MPRNLHEIVADFDALTTHDFDDASGETKGIAQLNALCDEMRELNNPLASAPVLFRTLERLENVELGTPGPLVHTLESWRGTYESLLAESVRRKPVPVTVWMINRILNRQPPDAASWTELLHTVAQNSQASGVTRELAANFRKQFTSYFKLLQPVAQTAFALFARTPFESLSEVDRTVILVWSLQGEVSNGGFDQFYFNSSGDHAAETVLALERIGAWRTAALVAEANRLFPTQPPLANRDARIAELETFSDTVTEVWDRLERGFYADPDSLDERLFEYLVGKGVLPEGAVGFVQRATGTDTAHGCSASDSSIC